MDKFVELENCWLSDRFVSGYDSDKEDYYIEDKYVGHKYYRSDYNYHMALVTLLNDRQGFINYIIDYIGSRIKEVNDEYDRVCRLGGGTGTILSDLDMLHELKKVVSKESKLWE